MKQKTAIRQLIETNDELRHAMQIIQNFIENGFQDQASLKEAWNLISEYVTRSESLESVNEQQIKDAVQTTMINYEIPKNVFDWFYSKLEAKDKEIAELKQTIEMRNDYYETKIENLNKAYGNEFKENLDLINQIADLKAKMEAADSKERFEMPDDKTVIDFAILFNDGILDHEQLSNMVGMCQMILDRLYEHGNVTQKSKQEIIDEQEL